MSPRTSRPVRDALLAVSLLTIVPTGGSAPRGERTGAAGWFPAVGLGLGVVVVGLLLLEPVTSFSYTQPLLSAALVVTVLALMTRLLHWDGLADVADAWWGGGTPARRLEIMSDSATGAFGATALVLIGMLQLTSVATILQTGVWAPLMIAPAVGRLAATCAAWLGAPAREGGLGRSVMGRPDAVSAFATVAVVAGLGWLGGRAAGLEGVIYVLVGVLLALAVPHVIARRMGGVTGDVMGASVMLVETALYVVAAVATGG